MEVSTFTLFHDRTILPTVTLRLGEDLSDEEDDHDASVGDVGGDETFSERLFNINIPQFGEPTGPKHMLLSSAAELS